MIFTQQTATVLTSESSHRENNGASRNSDGRHDTNSVKSTGELSQPAIIDVPVNNVLSNVELPKRREMQQSEGFSELNKC